jgi:glycosyltransferase involved in cell wall biosynthesis
MKTILIITDNERDQINGVVTTFNNIEALANRDGYSVVYIHPGQFPNISAPRYPEIKLSWPKKMGEKIKAANADHIHIATEGPLGVAARIWLDRNKIKYNTSYHTKFPEAVKKLFYIPEFITWAYVRWFHKNSYRVLTTTDSMVKSLQDHGFKNNVVSWTRGVDRDIFKSSLRGKTVAGRPILLCVSRVSKEKNLEDFFELDYPGATKLMVGAGPMLEHYEKKYPDVIFVGFKRGKDLAEYYANADVFVFPSKWETFGIVMIESMSCGTPVAAYPTQGPLDVVDQNVTGYMDSNLRKAVDVCCTMDRRAVEGASKRWSWENAWLIFKNNLIQS